jgi:Fe-S cluster assembly protein SufD
MKETLDQNLQTHHETFVASSDFAAINNRGWEAFGKASWPTRKNEEYKFTPLAQMLKRKVDFAAFSLQAPARVEVKLREEKGHHLVFVNGHFSQEHSVILEDGLTVTSLRELSVERAEEIVSFQKDDRPTVAINQAFFNGGLKLEAPQSWEGHPVFIYHVNIGDQASLCFPRIHVQVNGRAHLHIYEHFSQQDGSRHFTSQVMTAHVDREGLLNITKTQDYAMDDVMLDNTFIRQEGQSHVFVNTFSFSGGLVRNNLEIDILGEHAEANMYGTYLLDGKSHVDNHTVVDHQVAHCNSNELYKGILEEQATAVFNGKIFVRQPAQQTNAFQANNNISLSDQATIHTKPQLEIWADDVSCSHGCTIGQLDEEALFYLKSRGIAENKAKSMLLSAFSEETLKHIPLETVRQELMDTIENRLEI